MMDVEEARAKIEAVIKKVCPGMVFLKGSWEKSPEYPFCVVLYKGLKFDEANDQHFGDLDFAVAFMKDIEVISYDNGQTYKDYDSAASFTGNLAVKFVNALKKTKLDIELQGDAPALRYEENGLDLAGTEINFVVQSD